MTVNLLPLNTISLINSFKTAFACLLGLALGILFNVPSPQWTIITILVVMATQKRVGGAIRKGWSRLFATIIGATAAALVLFLFPLHMYLLYFFVIVLIFIFTYLAGVSKNYQDAFTVSSITVVMILISNYPQLHLAYDRFFEIILGVVIALGVTTLIFPIQSKLFIRKNLAKILQQTAELYTLAICQKQSLYSISQYSDLEENIIQSFGLQPVLLQEALVESIKFKKKKLHYITIQRLERRLLRSIYMMYESLKAPRGLMKQIVISQAFVLLNQDIIQTMKQIAEKLENKKTELKQIDSKIHLNEIIDVIKDDWEKTSFTEQIQLGSFIFCSQYLLTILYRLNTMVQRI